MKEPEHSITMEVLLGTLLRVGVIIAASVVLLGGIRYLILSGSEIPSLHVFTGEPARLTHIPIIFYQALLGRNRDIIQAGLLILISTPIARVILSLLLFMRERDWLYVYITLIVLALLLFGLIAGRG